MPSKRTGCERHKLRTPWSPIHREKGTIERKKNNRNYEKQKTRTILWNSLGGQEYDWITLHRLAPLLHNDVAVSMPSSSCVIGSYPAGISENIWTEYATWCPTVDTTHAAGTSLTSFGGDARYQIVADWRFGRRDQLKSLESRHPQSTYRHYDVFPGLQHRRRRACYTVTLSPDARSPRCLKLAGSAEAFPPRVRSPEQHNQLQQRELQHSMTIDERWEGWTLHAIKMNVRTGEDNGRHLWPRLFQKIADGKTSSA